LFDEAERRELREEVLEVPVRASFVSPLILYREEAAHTLL
jgi:hypothetical protein